MVIEFFCDSAYTDKITTWDESSGKFTATYDDTANTMTIKMTESGLDEINEATTVYADSVKRGYSDCTMRITYAATLTSDAQMGDKDNPNEVVLTWKRTNTTYYDTLNDCCHVYLCPASRTEGQTRRAETTASRRYRIDQPHGTGRRYSGTGRYSHY